MFSSPKTQMFIVAGMAAALLCPLCGGRVEAATQAADTAVVRLHISRMTCGSCPATARLALKRVPGVYGATVTLDDSLGVVRYDPRRVTPAQLAAHLTQLTGFGATILPDSGKASRP
jgi:copper chaperone CopZ